MGAKLSNQQCNVRNTSNIPQQTHAPNAQADCQYNFQTEIPSIIVDDMENIVYEKEKRSDFEETMKCDKVDCDDCKVPETFSKITEENKSVPMNSNNWFRIHPILQQGEKLSDTHYWFFNEPKHKRCHSARVKRHPPELYMNTATIFSSGDKEPDEEPELPFDLNEQISQEYARYRPMRRGNSETDKAYLLNMQRGLVIRLMFAIPTATETECNSVLIGANWDISAAERRLKVDMLHRQGFVNQQRCSQLLERHGWNYSVAEEEARREANFMRLERQHLSSTTSTRSQQQQHNSITTPPLSTAPSI